MKDKLSSLNPEELASNPRATLDSWLRYRSFVEAAYTLHPKPYIFSPNTLRPSTFATRLRDAIRGCLTFNYESTVPHADLAKWYSEIVVKYDDKKVYIGPPDQAKTSLTVSAVTSPTTSYTFSSLLYEEIAAFSLLLSAGRLVGPVKILQPPDISLLPSYPNVEVIRPGDGSIVLF